MQLEKQSEYIVGSTEELSSLISAHKISFLPRTGKITLNLNHFSEEEKSYWEDKLSNYFFNCACNFGAKVSVISGLVYLLYLILIQDWRTLLNIETIAWGFGIVIAGAVIGKLLGLIYYKILLMLSVKKLLKKLRENN